MSSLEEVFEDGYDSGGEWDIYIMLYRWKDIIFMIFSLEYGYHNNKKNKT